MLLSILYSFLTSSTAEGVANLFAYLFWRPYGFPKRTIAERDPEFFSPFWLKFMSNGEPTAL